MLYNNFLEILCRPYDGTPEQCDICIEKKDELLRNSNQGGIERSKKYLNCCVENKATKVS